MHRSFNESSKAQLETFLVTQKNNTSIDDAMAAKAGQIAAPAVRVPDVIATSEALKDTAIEGCLGIACSIVQDDHRAQVPLA